ncbi:tRNA(Ile2) 2-agmatinylcytidine synthetase TiaS [Nitrosotalea sinensis]|jgi:tRNA(Ile2)-agmatinylcytidine synthase|uniref:tRNA(Ile2) 2-agmatinylcytidine synthetase TiaS n=1 Tax=Nitrosotalea sinensis TaxID=1499975 RepID=A0A2H1EFD3_9ARCH|nr:tRNA(Ile)(2)-agmatinylcytidine synthase [Candidatus Nitrosotalea sinensis]SHO44175.1 tRNA(Ile2) 2-agmatinylcytidine synthetase TiaS [Candidatus Nitrosotalea sinensis]
MKESSILHIGFDDTDSRKGMCTTFLAYKIVEYLKKEQVQFLDYPYLIRFNPNVPWKTRGNGAVALKIKTGNPGLIKKNIVKFIQKYSAVGDGANPGLVFYEKKEIPANFSEFGKMALHRLVSRKETKKFVQDNELETYHLGNGQGLIGAIGAIGYDFRDHTFELISYRNKTNLGKKREISKISVAKMQHHTFPKTFNSFDESKNRILIAPHGPDPVLFGVRGEDPDSVIKGASMVQSKEKFCGYMVFRSNQGTGDHLQNQLDVRHLRPFSSGYLVGNIIQKPQTTLGGHVFFSISVNNSIIKCAIYKPTKLGSIAENLIEGDLVKVGGGIRKSSKKHGQVLNVEFLEILDLKKHVIIVNPSCTKCNKRMKSKGVKQGYQCIKCGNTAREKVEQEVLRNISKQFYLPVISAHRHLTRPMQRINKINAKIEFDNSKRWFSN